MLRVVSTVKERHYEPIDPTTRWAVGNETSLVDWQKDPAYSTWKNMPMTNKVCDRGDTDSRGRNFIISNDLWRFIHWLNFYDARAIKYGESVGRQYINRGWIDEFGNYRGPDTSTATDNPANADPFANAEPVFSPPNPLRIIGESKTHWQVEALNINRNWKDMKKEDYSWVKKPWLIHKASAENQKRQIQNVMDGLDVFWPLFGRGENGKGDWTWIPKPLLTLAPDPTQLVISGKRGVGYRLRGSHWILGLEDGSQVYVRHVTKATGDHRFYGYNHPVRTIIPPAWFK